ncbi:hypothetical protein BSPWISOXPB_5689 [uncultured Gammaproteobacteria bacterium]|nr:hypothetical protein BSPWISOXPB_5689 [uncultured Gammaproteobacteria bacterium]
MKPTIKPINISFRAFEIQDIEDVLVIERLAYKIPWNKAKFTHSLHNPNTVACLIFKDNQVLGYSIALRASKVADLLNFAFIPIINIKVWVRSCLFINCKHQVLKKFLLKCVPLIIAPYRFIKTQI